VDLVDGMIRDAFENIGKIGLRIDAAHLCRIDAGIDISGTLSTGIGATEEIVFAPEYHHPFILPMSVKSW
jgi:hypothetical protein